jgi:hypothetical protein
MSATRNRGLRRKGWLLLFYLGAFNLVIILLVRTESQSRTSWAKGIWEELRDTLEFLNFGYWWARFVEPLWSSSEFRNWNYDSSEDLWFALLSICVCFVAYKGLTGARNKNAQPESTAGSTIGSLPNNYSFDGDTKKWAQQAARPQTPDPKQVPNSHAQTSQGPSQTAPETVSSDSIKEKKSGTPKPKVDQKQEVLRPSWGTQNRIADLTSIDLGNLQADFPKRAEELRQHALSGEILSGDIASVAQSVVQLCTSWISFLEEDDRRAEAAWSNLMFDQASKLTDFEITLAMWCAVDKYGHGLVLSGNFDETRQRLITNRDERWDSAGRLVQAVDRLSELLEAGTISQAEYERRFNRLMDGQ